MDSKTVSGEMMNHNTELKELNLRASTLRPAEVIRLALSKRNERAVFTTSFGAEDQVLTHLIAAGELPIDIVTLDTGRLFNETLETFDKTVAKYGNIIKVFFPDPEDVEGYVNQNGPNAFFRSIDLRKACCHIRKVKPLERALKGYGIWITGLRAEQSADRAGLRHFDWDDRFQMLKVNPLLRWSFDEVLSYVHENFVPYNLLHDKGFVSIGCAPCTRAILPGEDFRAGRWWWEDSAKECGLHTQDHNNGAIVHEIPART